MSVMYFASGGGAFVGPMNLSIDRCATPPSLSKLIISSARLCFKSITASVTDNTTVVDIQEASTTALPWLLNHGPF